MRRARWRSHHRRKNAEKRWVAAAAALFSLQLWGKHGERYNVGPKKTIAELVYNYNNYVLWWIQL